ncbi:MULTISPECIES: HPF/RaiA family ribosome-associated protein [unclassified Luteimonas]|uniref:HPF/RaiA family ribosome-associated protein n=1 Tax=Lysobacteraceae TaxID=32033 RepID=UPI00100BBFB6|nr:HPF/RaiA family ribosome-associated protein [Luteimonas sp. YGD11-2]MCD9045564.1 HPF/RaiA family ribosome-associated protein [Luteimonas sp. MHLX1A]
MIIQLNTDNHIDGTDALETHINGMLEQHLGRFFPRLSRIEVFISDTNSIKGGQDKRCAIEVRMQNDDPIAASHEEQDIDRAVRGACDKLKGLLDSRIEKERGY